MTASQKVLQRGDVALLDRECVPIRSHGSRITGGGLPITGCGRTRRRTDTESVCRRAAAKAPATEPAKKEKNQDKQRFRLSTVATRSFTTMSTRHYIPEVHYHQRGTLAMLRQPWVSNMWTGLLVSLCNHETSMRSGCCKLLQPCVSH